MGFSYQCSLKQRRESLLWFILLFFPIFFGFSSYLIGTGDGTLKAFMGMLMFGIAALTFLICVLYLVQLYLGRGEWLIQVTQTELIWQVPQGVGEESFRVLISDIAKITYESHSRSETESYTIEMRNGKRYELLQNSGINITKFCSALKKMGVKYETNYLP